jgi:DNA polymerase-1
LKPHTSILHRLHQLWSLPHRTTSSRTTATLQAALDQRLGAAVIALDCETTGLDPRRDRVRLLQVAAPDHPVLIVDCRALSAQGWDRLRRFLAQPVLKLFHHAKFDLAMLQAAGVPVAGPYADTLLAAQLLHAGRPPHRGQYTLKTLVRAYLDDELLKDAQQSDWRGTLTPEQLDYAAADASVLLRLWPILEAALEAAQLAEVAVLEFAAVPALVAIERAGMPVDRTRWRQNSRP